MIEEYARVLAVEDDGFAWVETQRESACHACASKSNCGQGVVARTVDGRSMQLRLPVHDMCVDVGDNVVLGIEEGALLKGALLVYLLPLILMVVSAAVLPSLFSSISDVFVLLAALFGFGVGCIAVRYTSRRWQGQRMFHPVLLRKL